MSRMYEKTTLNNGLTIATQYMPNRVSASLGIWIKVGSRYEQARINGMSHFLEHLLFKGTQKRSCEQIKQSIEGIGGSLNGFTAEEFTCYLAKVPAKFTVSALEVLADMVLNARLEARDVEMERKVILEEIRMYKDLPGNLVADYLMKMLWPKQPLGMNIAGETESINSIKRRQLLSYKQRFYQPHNLMVVACGGLKHKQILQGCRKHISSAKQRFKQNKFVPAWRRQSRPQLHCQVKDTEQTHLALGLHSLSRNDPARFALGLLHVILGANMSSRLFREVREERGLAYEIGTAVKLFHDSGVFIVHAGIDNRRVQEAVEVIFKQLREVKKNIVEKDELNRAKEYYIGQLLLGLEDTSNYMLWLGEGLASLKKFLHPEEIIRKIEKIDAADLKHLANKIFQERHLNLALIGPLKDKDKKRIKQRLSF